MVHRLHTKCRLTVGGVGAGEAALRVSAAACAAATNRRASEPQPSTSGVSRGRAEPTAQEAETLRARRATAAGLDGGEPGVGAGLRARCGGLRAGDPGAECGGRVHPGMFGLGSGHQFREPKGVKRHLVCKRWTIEKADENSNGIPWFVLHRPNSDKLRFHLPSLPWHWFDA